MPSKPEWWNHRQNACDLGVFKAVCEKDEYKVHNKLKGKVVLDIGAHIGSFAYLAACRHAKRIYCYEPNPDNYKLLWLNMDRFANVKMFKKAIIGNNGEGAGALMSPSPGESWSGIRENGDIQVESIGIDEVLEGIGKVDILKIDCEGSEFPIFRSLKRWDLIGEIVGEYHDGPFGGTHQELRSILENRGFNTEFIETGCTWNNFWAWR